MIDEFFKRARCAMLPCEENQYKPRILNSRFLYGYAILVLVLKIVVIPIFLYLPSSAFFADITKTSIIDLANEARISLGLDSLKESQTLDEAALLKAQDMLQNDYFAHNSPTGVTPWHWFDQAGYNYRYAGENLAIGFVESEDVNQAWLNSPSHRENILNQNYTEIGIAVLTGDFQGSKTTIVVQLFGTKKGVVASNNVQEEEKSVAGQETTTVSGTGIAEKNASETTEKTSENTGIAQQENATGAVAVSNQNSSGEVLSAYTENPEAEKSFLFKMISFIASDYYDILQQIIYGSLMLIGLLLMNTAIFDIFVYRSYEIQYKDILLKTVGFCALLALLLVIDNRTLSQVITLNLFII
jgi:hypothetical protein